MTIETLARQGEQASHSGLAGLNAAALGKLRSAQMRNCFRHFCDTPDRMEYVAKIGDTVFLNDASARNVSATWYSLESVEGPVVWIAVGSSRATDYAMLRQVARQKVRVLICVGDDIDQLMRDFSGVVPVVEEAFTVEEAVHKAYYNRAEVHRVIFSPACDCGNLNQRLGERYNSEINEL